MKTIQEINNNVFCGDCVEIISQFPDNCIDLTVTSPPYDKLRSYEGSISAWNEQKWKDLLQQLFRATKVGGVVVWVVGDSTINGSETGTSFKQALYAKDIGFNLHDTMIFRKKNPIPQIYRKRYNNEFEYMFVFSKGVVKTHNPIMVYCLHAGLQLNGTTYKNYSKTVQTREKMANPVKDQKIKGNIWEYVVGKNAEDQDAKGHPAPFPCQLARDHISSWTNEGDVVLDPMAGSGTTLKMAQQIKRNYVGIEINQNYIDIINKRLQS